MATKTKQYFKKMLEVEKEVFDKFKKLHDAYSLNPDGLQEKFNQEGEKILEIISQWENKLCMQSEKGGYANFTNKLAENFRQEVRKIFPQIDNVGIIIEQQPSTNHSSQTDVFTLKKINFN